MKKIIVTVVFIISTITAFAQTSVYWPEDIARSLYSIQNLSGGVHIAEMDTPHNTMYNPASAAGYQRVILDLNYINLQGLGSYSGFGHVANLAASFPTKYGVLSSSLRWIGTDNIPGSVMDYGHMFTGNFTFSKEIYSSLYIGTGLNLTFGTNPGTSTAFDWGLGLNLGFIHMPGDLGFMKNFKWGIVLDNLGKGYGDGSGGYFEAIPGNVTIGTGVQFDFVHEKNFVWSLQVDLRSPMFTDLKFDIGTDILIGNIVNIDTSIEFTLRDLIAGETGMLIPSAGISVIIPLGGKNKEQKNGTSEIEVNTAASRLYDGVWAFGGGLTIPFGVLDETAPELIVDFDKVQYISPNFDGIQDELIIPITVNDERYITGYQLIIKNEEGYLVKEIYNKDERPENETLKNLFQRLVSEKTGTTVPQSFRWDGKGDSGEMVPDGTYNFTIIFWDDNRNFTEPYSGVFIIDTLPPEVKLEKIEGTDLIFSPDGDGNKDFIQFTQSGTVEAEWKGIITDAAGNVVKEFVWYGTMDNAIWDGTDNDGNLVPDGVYQYEVITIDEAGNPIKNKVDSIEFGTSDNTVFTNIDDSGNLISDSNYIYKTIEIEEPEIPVQDVISNIIVNTKKPPVNLYIDKAWFAPASENGEQEVVFTLDVPAKTGIVEWTLNITNSNGEVVKTFSSKEDGWGPVPETIKYDGKDKFNSVINEEAFSGTLTVRYQNGYIPVAESPVFNVDTTVPDSKIRSAYKIFSPNGDKNKDEAQFTQEGSSEDEWIGNIEDSNGNIIRSYSWKNGLDSQLNWDGRRNNGDLAADGGYTYYVTATDKAGNNSRSNIVDIILDNSSTEAGITVNLDAFSPNGDGSKDYIEFHSIIKEGSRIKAYSVVVSDKSGKQITSWDGSSQVPSEFKWDGKTESGKIAEDGLYKGHIVVEFEKGDVREADTSDFLLDTVIPVIDINAPYTVFSPDGDNRKDSIEIEQSSSEEEEFVSQLSDSTGNIVKTWFWNGHLNTLLWDGHDESGNIVSDGMYRYKVSCEDSAGNSIARTLDNIEIDTSDTPVFLTVKNSSFSPSQQSGINTQKFSMIVSNTKGIEDWKLEMVHNDGSRVKTFSGSDSKEIPSFILWDGLSENSLIKEGEYVALLSIEYLKGNNPIIESTPFILDNSAPDIRLLVQPQPFSPDDDNVDDELNISIAVDDISPVREWKMVIKDPKGRDFISFFGRGRPSERIIWDGRSSKGELVQSAEDYPYTFSVTDILGNSKTVDGNIPVDVLVVRDGDRFKIQISSITFKPDSAEYNDSGDLKEKNEKILKRIAEILKKYSSYRIIIEGNAASTKYYNKRLADKEEVEELQPLSLKRAETVQSSLISFGVSRSRLDVEGKGGTNPVVPHSDLENAWKNRRVEFILLK